MVLTYTAVAKKPLIFLRLTGVLVEQFQEIIKGIEPELERINDAEKKLRGRTGNLKTISDKPLALLLYYRTYITDGFIGYNVVIP